MNFDKKKLTKIIYIVLSSFFLWIIISTTAKTYNTSDIIKDISPYIKKGESGFADGKSFLFIQDGFLKNRFCLYKAKDDKYVVFKNNVAGYSLFIPNDMKISDLDDIKDRAVFENESLKMEIFVHDEKKPLNFFGYSNRGIFHSNSHIMDFRTKKINIFKSSLINISRWHREKLSRIKNDKNYYTSIEIYKNKKIYNIYLISKTRADKILNISKIIESFRTFSPVANDERIIRKFEKNPYWNEETENFYRENFSKESKIKYGIYEPLSQHGNYSNLYRLQREFGDFKFKYLLFYTEIYKNYKKNSIFEMLNSAYDRGYTVQLSLQNKPDIDPLKENVFYDVLNGKYDDYLREYAADVAKFGHPVIFRPFNEMNGDWCNYCAFYLSRDTNIYVELFRYLHRIFEEEGALKNTVWVWNPNEKSFPDYGYNRVDNYFPGDRYVDIIGLTGYNTGNFYEGEKWRSFEEIYDPLYFKFIEKYDYPYMITEFSCSSIGGDKSIWFENMFEKIKRYKMIKAAVFWDSADYDSDNNAARPYFLDDSEKTIEVFRKNLK